MRDGEGAPALDRAGDRYLVRGGAYTLYEGTLQAHRLVLLEFHSREAWENLCPRALTELVERLDGSWNVSLGIIGLLPANQQPSKLDVAGRLPPAVLLPMLSLPVMPVMPRR